MRSVYVVVRFAVLLGRPKIYGPYHDEESSKVLLNLKRRFPDDNIYIERLETGYVAGELGLFADQESP